MMQEVLKGRLAKIQANFESHTFVFICTYAPTLPAERMVLLDPWAHASEVIHPGQSYCVPARSIFDSICPIRDLFNVSKILGVDIGLISIDRGKAFDGTEHDYFWKTLQAFGFSSDFIAYIKILQGDLESVLKVNGGLCVPFKVYRGVRQGCSLSGIHYTFGNGTTFK